MTTLEKILALVAAVRAKTWWTAATLAFELVREFLDTVPKATFGVAGGMRMSTLSLSVEELADKLEEAVNKEPAEVGAVGMSIASREWLLSLLVAVARHLLNFF